MHQRILVPLDGSRTSRTGRNASVSGSYIGVGDVKLSFVGGGEKAASDAILPILQTMDRQRGGARPPRCSATHADLQPVCDCISHHGRVRRADRRQGWRAEPADRAQLHWLRRPPGTPTHHAETQNHQWRLCARILLEHFDKDLGIAPAEAPCMGLDLPVPGRKLRAELVQKGHGRIGPHALVKHYEA